MIHYVRASQVTPDEPREGWYVSAEHGPVGPFDSLDDALASTDTPLPVEE